METTVSHGGRVLVHYQDESRAAVPGRRTLQLRVGIDGQLGAGSLSGLKRVSESADFQSTACGWGSISEDEIVFGRNSTHLRAPRTSATLVSKTLNRSA